MGIEALKAKRAQAADKMKAITDAVAKDERTALTEDEKTAFEAAKKEYIELGDTIARMEESELIQAELDRPQPTIAGGRVGVIAAPAKKEFSSLGEFVGAVLEARLGSRQDGRLRMAEQSFGNGASGGFAVPNDFVAGILQVDPKDGVLRSLCRELPVGSSPDAEVSLPALDQSNSNNIYGGVSLSWTDVEADSDIASTGANIRMVKLKPHPVAGTIPITNSLLRNWSGAGEFYAGLLRGALSHVKELAIASGSGINKPLGVLNAGNGSLLKVNRTTSSHVKYADLVAMEAKFRGTNPKWIVSRRALPDLRLMEDTNGSLIFVPSARDGLPATMLGYDVVVDERGAALGSLGDVILADMGNYLIKQGSGPFIDVSEHIKFMRDRTVLRIVDNFDGQPWLKDPILSENDSSTVSPFVALDVP